MNDIWVGVAGNVATTPKTAVTANGHTVTSFRLACSVRRQDKATGEWSRRAAVVRHDHVLASAGAERERRP